MDNYVALLRIGIGTENKMFNDPHGFDIMFVLLLIFLNKQGKRRGSKVHWMTGKGMHRRWTKNG